MDQDTVVNDQLQCGGRLIDGLRAGGFDVAAAFWAKLSEEGRWYLYITSPLGDRQIQEAYRIVYTSILGRPELGIEPLEVRVIGLEDALTKAALAAIRPNTYPAGVTRFGRMSFGGVGVDGVYLYPPPRAVTSV